MSNDQLHEPQATQGCQVMGSEMSMTDEIDASAGIVDGEESTAEIPADTPSGRFFAPVQETLHLSGVSFEQRRWDMDDPALSEEYRLVISASGEVWQYPVRKEVIVGSADRCHVILPGPEVSQTHLALNTDGQLFWFRCLEVGGEILVDGKAIQEGWLRGGEELRVGDVRIYFMVPDRLQSKAKVPVPFESTEIKDHSEVLGSLRAGPMSSSDSYNQLDSVPAVVSQEELDALDDPGHSTMESEVLAPAKPAARSNTKLVRVAIVVFCLGVTAVLVAGALHLRERRDAKREAAVVARAAARVASIKARRRAAVLEALARQLTDAKVLLGQQAWPKAVKALVAFLREPQLNVRLRTEGTHLLQKAKREGAAAQALSKAQLLSIKEGRAREVLNLLAEIPANTLSTRSAELLRLTLVKELRYKLKMCQVMRQTQKLAAARTMLVAWFRVVPSAAEAKSLALTREFQAAQVLSTALGGIGLPAMPGAPGAVQPLQVSSQADKDALERLELGKLAFRMGRLEKSLQSFARVERLSSHPVILARAKQALAQAKRFKQGITLGLKVASRKEFARAIPLLTQALAAKNALGGKDHPRLQRALANMYAHRGQSLLRRKEYAAGLADLLTARATLPRHPALRAGWKILTKKADELLVDAKVLKSVDAREYKRVLRQVLSITAPFMKQHRRAKVLLVALK